MAAPLTTAPAVSGHPYDDRFVLHARSLRPEAVLDDTARFRDDRWPLRPAMLQRHARSLTLIFSDLPHRYRRVAKEWCYALLSGNLPPGEQRLSPSTVHTLLRNLAPFLRWLHNRLAQPGRPGCPALADLAANDLLGYARHLATTVRGPSARAHRKAAISYLWRYRTAMPGDRLQLNPQHIQGWHDRVPRAAENATSRIPEPVHGPLLAWSLRFLDNFAADILVAGQRYRALRDRRTGPHQLTHQDAGPALRELLDTHLGQHRPLPGSSHRPGQVNEMFLADLLDCSRDAIKARRADIQAVAAVVGVTDQTYLDIPIIGRLDNRPWLDGIAIDHQGHGSYRVLVRMLQAAAYTVVAFLSGMRDNEIKHLRRGCLTIHRDTDGAPYRWLVTSRAFKGERDPAGVPATWTVGEPAARAIGVLEQLQPPETDWLFAHLPDTPGYRHTRARTDGALGPDATNRQLNHLVQWINNYCAAHDRHDTIPPVNGNTWALSTRQFRRTLAWFIARRPGGVIAGAIQYRHLSVQVFEGYAGTSESGFRAEVESEQALARGEHLLTMIDTHKHTHLAGPSAEEAHHRLNVFGQHIPFPGAVITDQRRLQRLMDRHDPAIYPGKYVTCVHKHATALCQQQRDTSGQLRPDLGGCQPLSCRNVALAPDNAAAWQHEISTIDRRLDARPLLPPLLAHQLRSRRTQLTDFLDRHLPQEGT